LEAEVKNRDSQHVTERGSSLPTPPESEESPGDSALGAAIQEFGTGEPNLMMMEPLDLLDSGALSSSVYFTFCNEQTTLPFSTSMNQGTVDCLDLGSLDITPSALSIPSCPPIPSTGITDNVMQPTNLLAPAAFADDYLLEVPMAKLMQAGIQIANMLDCAEALWDPSTARTLQPRPAGTIPPCFQPTPAQRAILHHPFLDLLPWPAVRSKLIVAFGMPADRRPAVARDPLALMLLMADVEDEAEGFRVGGPDGLDADAWEIGQAFVSHWWWALDREVIEKSNRLRLRRGADRLRLMPASE
jgi:hypothetical protein